MMGRTKRNLRNAVLASVGLGLLLMAGPALAAAPTKAAPSGWGKLVAKDGKVIWLNKDEVIIGSAATAGARLQHSTVSPRHARMTHAEGVVHVSDLNSRLGTLVAGTALRKGKKMQIFQASTLSFGAVDMRFEWGDRGKLIKPLRKASKADKRKAAKRKEALKRKEAAKRKAAAKTAQKGKKPKAAK